MGESEDLDRRDKEDISLAIKDLGDVMESLHLKTTAKMKELKEKQIETSNFFEQEFKAVSDEFKTFNSLFDENKTEVILPIHGDSWKLT